MFQDGILMYCSQSKDGQGDFASIAIKDGRVEFRFDTGSGPAILRSGVAINAGAWYSVYIERKLREGKLVFSTESSDDSNNSGESTGISTTVIGKSPGSTRGLNIRTSLYFGGIDDFSKYEVAEGVGVKRGFTGCIDNLKISGLRRGAARARHGRTGGNANQRRKLAEINIEKSVVDSSNVLDCTSMELSSNSVTSQQIKGTNSPFIKSILYFLK